MFKILLITFGLLISNIASAKTVCDERVQYRPAHFDSEGKYFPGKHVMAECCTERYDEFPYGVKGPNAFKCYLPYPDPNRYAHRRQRPSVDIQVNVNASPRRRPAIGWQPDQCRHRHYRSHNRHYRYHRRYHLPRQ